MIDLHMLWNGLQFCYLRSPKAISALLVLVLCDGTITMLLQKREKLAQLITVTP